MPIKQVYLNQDLNQKVKQKNQKKKAKINLHIERIQNLRIRKMVKDLNLNKIQLKN